MNIATIGPWVNIFFLMVEKQSRVKIRIATWSGPKRGIVANRIRAMMVEVAFFCERRRSPATFMSSIRGRGVERNMRERNRGERINMIREIFWILGEISNFFKRGGSRRMVIIMSMVGSMMESIFGDGARR